ncbi:hypothetical protein ACFWY5_40985 [Nonomuraea sp. NPDC059007]|uniref:hypothetical protein n=1 Tax=Nonomuraea sp. NPDC059007 TaxID=3346692 RepID=UPI0036C7B613
MVDLVWRQCLLADLLRWCATRNMSMQVAIVRRMASAVIPGLSAIVANAVRTTREIRITELSRVCAMSGGRPRIGPLLGMHSPCPPARSGNAARPRLSAIRRGVIARAGTRIPTAVPVVADAERGLISLGGQPPAMILRVGRPGHLLAPVRAAILLLRIPDSRSPA